MSTIAELELQFEKFSEGDVIIIQPKREASWEELKIMVKGTDALSKTLNIKIAVLPFDFDLYRVDAELMKKAFNEDGAV